MATPKKSPDQLGKRGRKPLVLPPLGYGAPDPTTAKGKADAIRLGAAYQAAEAVVRAGLPLDSDEGRSRANKVYRDYCEQKGLPGKTRSNVSAMRSKWTKILERDLAGPYFGMNLEQYVRQFIVAPENKLRADLQGCASNMMVRVLEHKHAGKADARHQAVKAFVSWALWASRVQLAEKWGRVPAAWIDAPGAVPAPRFDRVKEAWTIIHETLPATDDRHAFLAAAHEQLGACPEDIARNFIHT